MVFARSFLLIAVMAVIAASCGGDSDTTTTTTTAAVAADTTTTTAAPATTTTSEAPSGEPSELKPIDDYGMRHRAAFAFVEDHQDSLALVVSQDGGLRVAAWTSDGLTLIEQG
jgi:hypothetical protein